MITGQTTSPGLVSAWGALLVGQWEGGNRRKKSGANVRFWDKSLLAICLCLEKHTQELIVKKQL